ncbi:MAG: hypothetical protein KF795_31475 [Labilithrix sp.]|nr:hypothetical protein [Labilithrix sp.]
MTVAVAGAPQIERTSAADTVTARASASSLAPASARSRSVLRADRSGAEAAVAPTAHALRAATLRDASATRDNHLFSNDISPLSTPKEPLRLATVELAERVAGGSSPAPAGNAPRARSRRTGEGALLSVASGAKAGCRPRRARPLAVADLVMAIPAPGLRTR